MKIGVEIFKNISRFEVKLKTGVSGISPKNTIMVPKVGMVYSNCLILKIPPNKNALIYSKKENRRNVAMSQNGKNIDSTFVIKPSSIKRIVS